jgi:hypothetical protein
LNKTALKKLDESELKKAGLKTVQGEKIEISIAADKPVTLGTFPLKN